MVELVDDPLTGQLVLTAQPDRPDIDLRSPLQQPSVGLVYERVPVMVVDH
ncbi:hypothetical protein [Actinopolymorpha cephalotaxi]|uniref:Uncharacterized protein n=1 Tax=Actinopolymorpha cephalotaxi TaxID=504797 RepID=A0ABX2SCJ5_9ACTN|nr:hypothetical protein [Actinopolymorpha cephalotaxi]NYH87056.1 hypothetical protein [Actinopolymorpha cephalotaxi]